MSGFRLNCVEFSEVIKRRRMVRAFTTQPLPHGTAERLLRAANRAPSAGFSQGYSFLVFDGPEETTRFWDARAEEDSGESRARREALSRAPLIVVPLASRDMYLDRYARADKGWSDRDEARWPVPYWYIDTGFTALLMLLQAVDDDLGAVFFGVAPEDMDVFRAAFGVPETWTPIGAVAVGYPDPGADKGGSSRSIKRKSLDELVHRGHW
jgi:nitroreductase